MLWNACSMRLNIIETQKRESNRLFFPNDVIWENLSYDAKFIFLVYWYYVKVWIILFPEFFTWVSFNTGIKGYRCSKAIENKEKHNRIIILLISFILQFTFCDMWRVFPDRIPKWRTNRCWEYYIIYNIIINLYFFARNHWCSCIQEA